jgi:drug/metabolite transporter (DMT)-like permease
MMQSVAFAFLTVVVLAVFQLVLRGAMQVWPVGMAGVLSRIASVVLIGACVCITGDGWRRLRPRGAGGWLLLMGVVAIAINILWFGALKFTTATNSALLLRLDLVFVVLIGQAWGLERISLRGWLAVPAMMVGLMLVMEVYQLTWRGHFIGDVMTLLTALGLACNAFVVRRILRQMDENAAAFYNLLMTMIGFGGLALYEGLTLGKAVPSRPEAWWWLAVIGILAAVGTPLYYAALRRMMVWKLRAFLLLTPPVVALAEWVLWDVRLSLPQWLGATLILAGVLVLIWDEAVSNKPTAAEVESVST